MSKISLEPRKTPCQIRSKITRDIILEAAIRILSKESLENYNTNYVAEVAGVSIGTLYQYFPNKSALIAALIEKSINKLLDTVEKIVHDTKGMSLRDALFVLARFIVDQQYSQPLLAAALDQQELQLPIGHILKEAKQQIVEHFSTFLSRYQSEFLNDFPDYVPHDCHIIAKAMVEADIGLFKASKNLEVRIVYALIGYLKEVTSE